MRLFFCFVLLFLLPPEPQAQKGEVQVSFSAPLAVVGIMSSPSGAVAATRRDAVWEAWADIESNSPSLVGVVKPLFVVGLSDTDENRKKEKKMLSNDYFGGSSSTSGMADIGDLIFEERGQLEGSNVELPILRVPIVDAYNRVVDKYLYLCRWAISATNAAFVIKADDDTFLRIPLVASALSAHLFDGVARGVYYGQFCTGVATRVCLHLAPIIDPLYC